MRVAYPGPAVLRSYYMQRLLYQRGRLLVFREDLRPFDRAGGDPADAHPAVAWGVPAALTLDVLDDPTADPDDYLVRLGHAPEARP